MISQHGIEAEQAFRAAYPDLDVRFYGDLTDLEQIISDVNVVIVHEWNDPDVIAEMGRLRQQNSFTLLFHDTHHRLVSDPEAMRCYDLSNYDAVLAFGITLAEIYRKEGWGSRAYVWHEAADTRIFQPPSEQKPRAGAVWIGNWGDGEREAEIEEFLLAPAKNAALDLDIYGVRYPDHALAMLHRYGAFYHGWIANSAVPTIFARHAMTVHVPRCFYARVLPGIPTIRVFEALASEIPLISAPWADIEQLFRAGQDYLTASDGEAMRKQMLRLKNEPGLGASLAASGRERIIERHSCDIRVEELLRIVGDIRCAAGALV